MPDTKIGFDQMGRPAPLLYRRFSSAMIIFIIPGAIGLVSGWGMSDALANRWLMVLGFLPAAIKGLGAILGDGQEYATQDEMKEKKP